MRTTFGDYREKMKNEELKMAKNVSTVKFTTGKSEENKSVFLKKANPNSNKFESQKSKLSNNSEPFKFNFL